VKRTVGSLQLQGKVIFVADQAREALPRDSFDADYLLPEQHLLVWAANRSADLLGPMRYGVIRKVGSNKSTLSPQHVAVAALCFPEEKSFATQGVTLHGFDFSFPTQGAQILHYSHDLTIG
jgi:hypothetical protein